MPYFYKLINFFIMKHFKPLRTFPIAPLLVLLILSGSCDQPERSASNQATHQKIVYEDILQPSVHLSELFNTYEVVVLDDAEGKAMFGDITKVLEANGKTVVFDKENANSVFVYDQQGSFIFKTEQGEGPTQTLSIEDFTIDEDSMQLIVLDNGAMSIKFFDLEDGSFVKSIKINDYHYGIMYTNGKIWLKNSFDVAKSKYDKAKIIVLDPHANEENTAITPLPLLKGEDEAYTRFVAGDITFLKAGSTIFYAQEWGNKIYSFSEDGNLLDQIEIDFGEAGFHNFSSRIKSEADLRNTLSNNSLLFINNSANARSGDQLIYSISNGADLNFLFVNADFSQLTAYKAIDNDLFDILLMPFIGSSNNAAYMAYRPEIMSYFHGNGLLNETFIDVLGQEFDGSNANPILVRLLNQESMK
jgi:hypothetical protein